MGPNHRMWRVKGREVPWTPRLDAHFGRDGVADVQTMADTKYRDGWADELPLSGGLYGADGAEQWPFADYSEIAGPKLSPEPSP